MVLCAGLGTRLRPLTEVVPKPLLPVLGVEVLAVTFAAITQAGISRVIINTHHLAETTARAAEDLACDHHLSLQVLNEPTILGTGGGVKNAESYLAGADAIVLINGDTFIEAPIDEMLEVHRRTGAVATMLVRDNPDPRAYAPVEADASGRIFRVAGRPTASDDESALEPWLFAGVHVLTPRLLADLPIGVACDINRTIYPTVIARGERVQAAITTAPWFDLGTPARLLAAHAGLLDAPTPILRELLKARGVTRDAQRGTIATGAVIAASACILRSGLARRVRVGAHAEVRDSLVLAGAEIGDGAIVDHCIVGPDTLIYPGERLTATIALGQQRSRFNA